MFKYYFNKRLFTADTLEELQTLLEAQGYTGNIIAEYKAVADNEQEGLEVLANQQQEELELLKEYQDSAETIEVEIINDNDLN